MASIKPAAVKECTAIVSYKVKEEDIETFLDSWDRANAFLKKQSGHVSSTLRGAVSANPPFRFVNVAKWKSAEAFRKATHSSGYQEASGGLRAFPVRASVYDSVRG